ncbi:MAG: flippase-like domain-containing protein [Mediterranea sp.]|jgi:uncharacterized protein (TIRG00374 family)|nr:flippase-like domain-containing protein [Mediterranea sp.]
MKKSIRQVLKLLLPIALGGFILYWVYRDFDFARAWQTLAHGTRWGWLLFSLLFGILPQAIRGWRWRQLLEPLDAYPRRSNCVYAVFVSYAASLLVPRLGEVSRCGILSRSDQVPFAKSLGTVVTERLVDMLTLGLVTLVTVLTQFPLFTTFLRQTGTKIPSTLHLFTSVWFYIALLCVTGVLALLYSIRKTLFFYERVKGFALNLREGVLSLRHVPNIPLFVFYTVAIWGCYFLHFYLTFYCFGFSEGLGLTAALVMFVGGTFAIIVPTPNGAGPWHFAVITMMMLYGVDAEDAGIFALIVHGVQTFLVVLLGVYGWAALSPTKKINHL